MDSNQIMVMGDVTPRFRHHAFVSDVNFAEFKIVIIAIPKLVAELQQIAGNRGAAPARTEAGERFARLNRWVREGHSLIVIVPSSPFMPVLKQVGYQFIQEEVFGGVSFVPTAGQLVDYCGPAATRQILGPWAQHLEYKMMLEGADLRPLFEVRQAKSGARQLVGGFRLHGTGHVILVPWLKIGSDLKSENYIDALIAFADAVKGEKSPLPEWAARLWTKGEESAQKTITQLRAQVADLDNEIASQTQFLHEAAELKN